MKKIRELLKLKFEEGLSTREAARRLGVSKSPASDYIAGFSASGLTLEQASRLSDTEFVGLLTLKKMIQNPRYQQLSNQFENFEKELKRTGVTLYLLWGEYLGKTPEGYAYSQFCFHFDQWQKSQKVSMHVDHKAGDKMYVDFTGTKHSIIDSSTGEITELEVFVAVLGCSQYAYIEAVPSQTKADWVQVNENALRFFGGVPRAIVPDCLKSAVIKADKYEPVINETFNDFGRHYGTTILPARSLHPKDKSLAENFVRIAYTRIFAPLRNQVFHTLNDLNQAFLEQLEVHNQMKFKSRGYSRSHLFEEVERSALRPLPVAYYDLKEYYACRVQYNYYAYLKPDLHYYSVPVQYTGKKVLVGYSNRLVEIYHDNLRIAMHPRNRRPYQYTVDPTHRPANHQFIADWTTERFIRWGEKIGPEARQLIEKIFESKAHPEQGFRSCIGILGLAKKYTKEDFLKACKKGMVVGCISYPFIKNTLKNKTFNLEADEELKLIEPIIHDFLRGKEGYN